jgi:hypothetical protein
MTDHGGTDQRGAAFHQDSSCRPTKDTANEEMRVIYAEVSRLLVLGLHSDR